MSDETAVSAERRRVPAELIVGGLLAAAVLLLIFQNTDDATIEWLVFEWTAQLWIVRLVTAVVGIVAAELVGRAIRRRRRRRS